MRNLPLVSVLALLLVACCTCESPTAEELRWDPEEYEVCSVAARQLSPDGNLYHPPDSTMLVIYEWTAPGVLQDYVAAGQQMHYNLEAELGSSSWNLQWAHVFRNFQQKNLVPHRLQREFQFGLDYTLMSSEEMEDIFVRRRRGWDEFNRRYPHSPGIINFSRVGFDEDRGRAVVYIANQWGGTAGVGYLMLFHKDDGSWKLQKKYLVYVS